MELERFKENPTSACLDGKLLVHKRCFNDIRMKKYTQMIEKRKLLPASVSILLVATQTNPTKTPASASVSLVPTQTNSATQSLRL